MGLVESPDMFDRHSNLSIAMPRNDPLSWSSLRAPLLPRADWQTPPTGGDFLNNQPTKRQRAKNSVSIKSAF